MQVTTALKWPTLTRRPHPNQGKPRLFHRFGKEEALTGIRLLLNDPTLCYQTIAQRQRQRKLLAPIVQREPDYPANVRVVIQKLKRAGLEVTPSSPTAKRTLLAHVCGV